MGRSGPGVDRSFKHVVTVIVLGVALLVTGIPGLGSGVVPDTLDVPIYVEDFEFSDGGWETSGTPGVWEWGEPDEVPEPPPGQSRVWGTVLTGDHPPSACSFVTSPVIHLPPGTRTGLEGVRLTFLSWYLVEASHDATLVQVSTDGGATWQTLDAPYDGPVQEDAQLCFGGESPQPAWSRSWPAPPVDEWTRQEVDLSDFMGNQVRIRFGFASDPSFEDKGFYFDDVRIESTAHSGGLVPSPLVPFTPVETVYAEDFEDHAGWWEGTGGWAWGEPQIPPGAPPNGQNVWGTVLDADHANNSCAFTRSFPLELPHQDPGQAVQLARMTFELWYSIEEYWDAAILQASTDGGSTWMVLDASYDAPTSIGSWSCLGIAPTQDTWTGTHLAEWVQLETDVTHLLGEDVILRFGLASDSSVTHPGIYFTDVVIETGTAV